MARRALPLSPLRRDASIDRLSHPSDAYRHISELPEYSMSNRIESGEHPQLLRDSLLYFVAANVSYLGFR